MMAQTKLQRYLFDLSRIPPQERAKYLRTIDGLSNSGCDMVDRNGHYAGWFDRDSITSLRGLLPSSLAFYPFPPGRRTDGR